MKKSIFSVFLFMLATYCLYTQAYTGNTHDNAPGRKTAEANVIFEESFEKGLADFVVEGPNGPAGDPIWKFDEWGTQDCINASMWSGTDTDIDSYLVSPVMKLGRENTASFSHGVAFTISGDYSEYFGFCVREEGSTTWEELNIPVFPKSDAKISSGDIIIPETYNGKNVQVAFRYHANHVMQLSWYIKKLIVKGIPVSDSGKEYAGIEFASERVNYLFGSKDPFVAPELKNPNNLDVTFSSSNTDAATVDASTGKVTIKALGKTVIKAESKETEKFEAGLAQYTLNIVETLEKLDAGIAWDVKELNTTFPQEPGFVQPVLLNPNKRPVELSTSNEGVAIVDASTGIIHIQGLGIATITATSPENDDYKAGKATTTLVVTDATKVFAASFSQDDCMFTEEGTTGAWKWNDGAMTVSGKGLSAGAECLLVSPEMELGADDNFMKFEHICKNFNNPEEQAVVVVREAGTDTWTLGGAMWYTKKGTDGFISSGLVRIPNDFNGKKVQLAFRFKMDGSNSDSEWTLRNLIVTKNIIKKDAGIYYDVNEINFAMGNGEFKAPVLNNPNNLSIEYMCDNYNVANVDRETGEVFISGTGTCTITARSNETAEYKQGIAQYVINVTDPYLVFRDSFNEVAYGLGNFTEEGAAGCWGISWGLASTSPWNTEMAAGEKSTLVSPTMKLGAEGNTLTFDQKFMFVNGAPEKYGAVVIRTTGGEWETVDINYPATEDTEHSGNITLPEKFNGKDVQIGFMYTRQEKNNGYDGTWTVNNIIVRSVSSVPQEKADPELSFTKTEVYFDINSGLEFTAPVLNNPNNVDVTYTSSNTDVATADCLLGSINIISAGETIITAASKESELFKAGSASYKIIVTNTSGIEYINGIKLEKNVIYDLSGRKVNKPTKGIFIVNGKKIIIK